MNEESRRSKWMRRLARAALVVGVVLSFGATPGCLCRSRTYVPAGGVVVTRPVYGRTVVTRPVVTRPMARPAVRVAPAPNVRVGAPTQRRP